MLGSKAHLARTGGIHPPAGDSALTGSARGGRGGAGREPPYLGGRGGTGRPEGRCAPPRPAPRQVRPVRRAAGPVPRGQRRVAEPGGRGTLSPGQLRCPCLCVEALLASPGLAVRAGAAASRGPAGLTPARLRLTPPG